MYKEWRAYEMKQILSCLTLIAMLISVTPVAFAKESTTVELADKAKSAVLIERDTGTILYDKNSEEKLPPASMTKIMTMLLIMEALEKNQIKMDEMVRTSEYAASMGGSQIFLEPGEEMTVEQMLKGIAIGSGNDASVAMAEKIAGSNEEFVSMMNKKVKELGLKNTHFKNPTGLPEPDHYSSAHDMAIMAKELLKYEEITNFTGKYEAYLRENTDKKFWLVNTNRLVKFYPGVDGVKTGFTNEAKYCLTATAKKGDMRVIAVVFGADTPKERNSQVTKMLDYAFSQFQTHPLFEKDHVLTQLKINKGKEKEANLITSESISVLTKKGESVDDVTQEIVMKKDVQAPIKMGDELGSLRLMKDNKIIAESKLIAEKDIVEASWWELFQRVTGQFTKSS